MGHAERAGGKPTARTRPGGVTLAIADPAIERKYTLTQAAEKLGFPSGHALRMFLKRRPDLIEMRYRRAGRSLIMLLTESDLRVVEVAITRIGVKS